MGLKGFDGQRPARDAHCRTPGGQISGPKCVNLLRGGDPLGPAGVAGGPKGKGAEVSKPHSVRTCGSISHFCQENRVAREFWRLATRLDHSPGENIFWRNQRIRGQAKALLCVHRSIERQIVWALRSGTPEQRTTSHKNIGNSLTTGHVVRSIGSCCRTLHTNPPKGIQLDWVPVAFFGFFLTIDCQELQLGGRYFKSDNSCA